MTAHQSFRWFHSKFNRGGARICLFLGVIGLLMMPIGCTSGSSENADSAPPNAAAQPAKSAPAQPAQPAPAKPANPAIAKVNDNASKPVRRGGRNKGDDVPDINPNQPTKPISKPVAEWTIDDMKTALVNKDLRYVAAVTSQAAKARGDAQKETEIAQLLDAVAKMPADAAVPGTAAPGGRRGKDDDGPQQPPANTPAGAVATPSAPGAALGFGPPPKAGGFRMGRGDD